VCRTKPVERRRKDETRNPSGQCVGVAARRHVVRTTDIATAISAHNAGANGQGTPAGQAFNALSTSQKSDLIAYLNTL